MRLHDLLPEEYARDVLPLTAPLWAGGRSFDEYVAQTLEFARSRYGHRHYRTIGLYDGGTLVASFKRYERSVRDLAVRRKAIGFGAVFTPPALRGRGYASVMLAMALDRARAENFELAYLFSDIRPQFYAALGFRALTSREFALRADSLPAARLDLARLTDADWPGVRRIFGRCEALRPAAFVREADVWEELAARVHRRSERFAGGEANFVVRRGGRIVAYVLGVRDPRRDALILDEFGFGDDAAGASIPALIRAAAGDLQSVRGWRPPPSVDAAFGKSRVRRRRGAIFMMMALHAGAQPLCDAAARTRADFCWSLDHV